MADRINILSIDRDQLIELMEVAGLDPSMKNQAQVVKLFNEYFDWHDGADVLLDAIADVKEVNAVRTALKKAGLRKPDQRDVDNMIATLETQWAEELTANYGREKAIEAMVGQYMANRPEGGYESPEYRATETWREENK